MEEKEKDKKGILAEVFSMLEEQSSDPENFEEIGAVLALPEEHFTVLSPLFLEKFEQNLQNIDDQVLLAQMLNLGDIQVDEVASLYEELIKKLDTDLAELLSPQKRSFVKQLLGAVVNNLSESEHLTKRIIQVPIEVINEDAVIPRYARRGDAGLDLYATDEYVVLPGETILIPTGLKVALPRGYELQVRPRSGQSLKTKLRIANTPGTIDSGYRDEIGVIVENIEPKVANIVAEYGDNGELKIKAIDYGKSFVIEKGQRFAQLVLCQIPTISFYEVDSVAAFGEDRGGGFGSSDVKKDGKN